MAQNEGPSDPNHKEQLAQGALNGLQREFLVIGKTRVKSWHAWLLIGLAVGIVGGIVFAANRDGEFTPIQTVVESDVEKVTPGIFEGDVRELPRIEPPRPGEPEREIPRGQVYISSLTPNSGPIGTKVTVTGFRFTAREKNTIHFGSGVIPDLTALKDSETLTFAVPESIGPACLYIVHPCDAPEYLVIPGTYSVWVTNANGTSNSMPFTVTSHQRVLERVREQVSELKMTEGETVKIPGTEITIRARKVTDQAELEVMQGRATKVLALYRSETPGTAKREAFGSTIELVARSEKQITLRVTSAPSPTQAPATPPPPSNYSSLKIAPHPNGGMYLGQYDTPLGDLDIFEQAIGRKVALWGRTIEKPTPGAPILPPLPPGDAGRMFNLQHAEASWKDGKATYVQLVASPSPITGIKKPDEFTVDKLLRGDYEPMLRQVAAELRKFGKPMFFISEREPNGIEGAHLGGFGTDGSQSIAWARANKKGLAEFDPSQFPNAHLYADLGKSTVCDGVERLVAAQRYYHDFFVRREGLNFLTFDTMGWAVQGPANDDLIASGISPSDPYYQLVTSCFDFKNFYPGDKYVDWVSINFYILDENIPQNLQNLNYTMAKIKQVAPTKPVLILELGFPDGAHTSSPLAAQKVTAGLHELMKYPEIKGFAMWQRADDAIAWPYDTLVRPNTLQGNTFKAIVQANPNYFHSCVYFSDGSRMPTCDLCLKGEQYTTSPITTILPTTNAVTVDFSIDEGPVTYRASGFFQVAGVPLAMVQPLKPKLVTWVPWLRQDYIIAKQLGADFQFKLGSSGLMGDRAWPGDNGNWTEWLGSVRSKVQDVLANKYDVQYDIWNEPDGEWQGHCGSTESSSALEISNCYGRYLEIWQRTVLLIRELDPHASVVGPSSIKFPFVKDTFLPYALKNNVLPDVLSWHSFGNDLGASLPAEVAEMRKYIKDNGITRIKKISINEYENQSNATNAAVAVKYFYELEKAKPDSAARACWQEGGVWVCAPQLNNLLTPQTCTGPEGPERSCLADWKPRSIWYAYKGYADITGRLVGVRPYQNIYGVAGQDSTKGEARMVLGRAESAGIPQTITVQFTNLNTVSFLAGKSTIRVEAERVPASGTNASASPTKVISQDYPVSGNILQITLPNFGPGDVYTLILRAPSP